jgi:predicted enzyme related to lactoylglutathione lyase
MSRVVHFEIHAEQPERAVRFYTDLLGWEFTSWGGPIEYWLVNTGPADKPGINGGLVRRRGPGPAGDVPVIGYVCTVDVSSVDEYLAKAVALGAVVAVPKMAIPGVGWLAYAKDTEGNVFGLMQNDPTAK